MIYSLIILNILESYEAASKPIVEIPALSLTCYLLLWMKDPLSACLSLSYSLIYMIFFKAPCGVDGQAPWWDGREVDDDLPASSAAAVTASWHMQASEHMHNSCLFIVPDNHA